MKVPPTAPIWCLLIVCITLLAFTLLVRKSLCEIRYRDTNREVAAFMAYESVSSNLERWVRPPLFRLASP
ncbi:TPA: type I toxin-antitoxin system Hok family toxin [Klebsiella michiganensis]|nr:type I toxin-antitoxin system Hok family toxin [Klebsiella michiganensis]